MLRRFVAAAILLCILGLLVYTVLLNPGAQASPKELNVVTKTGGHEELKATILDDQIKFSVKNNHAETITAFAVNFGHTTVKEDFAYSDIHFGIEPGDTFETSYPLPASLVGSESFTLYFLAVLLKDGTKEGDSKVAQEIKDERLGEKIQIFRMLKILEKEDHSRKDIKALKGEIAAALNAGEHEARILRKELLPTSGIDDNLSEGWKSGLHWGREKMLRRFQVLEQLPTERQEEGFIELKDRAHKLFAKL
jgi:hypothetical protein